MSASASQNINLLNPSSASAGLKLGLSNPKSVENALLNPSSASAGLKPVRSGYEIEFTIDF